QVWRYAANPERASQWRPIHADNQSQELLIVGTSLAETVSPCVWDPPSALCIGTVCWLVCRWSAAWLSGPGIALVDSCLVCTFGVPLSSDPLIYFLSNSRLALYPPLLPLPTVYNDSTQPSEAISNFPTTSPLLTTSYFHQLRFPSVVVVSLLIDNCLSALHRLSPAYPTPSKLRDQFPQCMPEFKASKVTALAPPV
ncbi:hypothetical protein N7471_013135, partial [Penicillium samsonianum]|uniref:uncharacterized protein n=1 Tax=Penicillium samsonianum TaxID=1882272 RepID=UPI00254981EA